jgi:hypothetical protein
LWPEFCASKFCYPKARRKLTYFPWLSQGANDEILASNFGGMSAAKANHEYPFSEALDGSVYSCALGAAYEGIAGQVCWDSNRAYDRLNKTFPVLNKEARCPVKGCRSVPIMFCTLGSIITHLNDDHGWSREWIALEVVRPYEEQADVDDFPTAA